MDWPLIAALYASAFGAGFALGAAFAWRLEARDAQKEEQK